MAKTKTPKRVAGDRFLRGIQTGGDPASDIIPPVSAEAPLSAGEKKLLNCLASATRVLDMIGVTKPCAQTVSTLAAALMHHDDVLALMNKPVTIAT